MSRITIITIVIISIFFPSFSFAEWNKVAEGARGDTSYIEGKTGKIKGKIRSYNMLVDYAERTVLGDLSYKTLVEVNCKNLSYRYLSTKWYKKPLARGKTSSSGPTKDRSWKPNTSGSVMEYIKMGICAIKR